MGSRAGRRRRRLRHLLPRPRLPRRGRHRRPVRRLGCRQRRAAARAAVRPGRGRRPASRGESRELRRRLDARALRILQPELRRGLRRRDASRHARHSRWRYQRAVPRCRRHRRRRLRGPDRRPPHRTTVRVDWSSPAHVRRCRGRADRRHGPPGAVPISELFAEVLDGRNSYLTDGVAQALGRSARDFSDYARDIAASGAWNLEAEAS